jgi:4-hydroxybenzoate polyprenyltransferase
MNFIYKNINSIFTTIILLIIVLLVIDFINPEIAILCIFIISIFTIYIKRKKQLIIQINELDIESN